MNKDWNRVIFNIDQINGKIQKNSNNSDILNKVRIEDIQAILSVIESKTNNFRIIRRYTKCKICLFVEIFLLTVFAILCLSVYNNFVLASVLIAIAVVIVSCLLFLTLKLFKLCTKNTKKIVEEELFKANQRIFLRRSLYMVPCKNLKFIAIYILPKTLNLSVLIHNYNLHDLSNDQATGDEILKVNRKSLFEAKYTNFNNNYITAMRI
jgi:hypothetical protein